MQKMSTFVVAAAGVLGAGSFASAATVANATSGLSGAGTTTITFESEVVAPPTAITNQYAGSGVTFTTLASGGEGTIYQYGGEAGGLDPNGTAADSFINFDIANGGPGGTRRTNPGETIIAFGSNVSAATLQLTGQGAGPGGVGVGTVTLTSFLNGVQVEQVSGPVDFNGSTADNYFGFTNSLFNAILITPGTSDNALLGDNLAFTVVPEPASLSLIGLAGAAALRRRRRI